MSQHRLREFVIDPQSNGFSMSRLCLGVLTLDVLILSLADAMFDKVFTAWSSLALIIGSVAGAYGVNSALRVWRGKVIDGVKEDKKGE